MDERANRLATYLLSRGLQSCGGISDVRNICPMTTGKASNRRGLWSAVVIAGLQHHDVMVVDEVDKSVFLIDAA